MDPEVYILICLNKFIFLYKILIISTRKVSNTMNFEIRWIEILMLLYGFLFFFLQVIHSKSVGNGLYWKRCHFPLKVGSNSKSKFILIKWKKWYYARLKLLKKKAFSLKKVSCVVSQKIRLYYRKRGKVCKKIF